MLERMKIAFDGAAAQSLSFHLNGGVVTADELRPIYEEMDDDVKHSGNIYRGIGIAKNNVSLLLMDERFTTLNLTEHREIDSWSVSIDDAKRFAYKQTEVNIISVVLRDQIRANDERVVMDLSEEAFSNVFHEVDYWIEEENVEEDGYYELLGSLEQFQEQEILIQHTGSEVYSLCDSVVYMYVDISELHSHDAKAINVLKELVDVQGADIIDKLINTNERSWSKRVLGFECWSDNTWVLSHSEVR